MKRAKHTLSHYRMVTGNMGTLMPIGCVPVLPGDTVQHHTSALIRVTPLNTPVMHPVSVRVHHFFVPNRIVFPEWEDFITGGEDGMDATVLPTIATTTDKKSVLSYLGIPPIAGVDVLALPLIGFNRIYNEYYRDQHLVAKRADLDNTLPKIAWEKDYFTTSRPWSQLGPDVVVPVGGQAPLHHPGVTADSMAFILDGEAGRLSNWDTDVATANVSVSVPQPSSLMYADLSTATGASVNEFRASFAIQRYQEARARYGARFTEYLRYLGITPSDARLQRPEFLGGGTSNLNFSEVLQTVPNLDGSGSFTDDGVGDLYGHGIAGLRSNKYRKFFEEHGYIISVLSLRPKSLYLNGIPREFLKLTKEDFFQKELANLGQQEIYEAELYAESLRNVFGYQDRYQEYRYQPSQVSQDFRDTLNAWHLGRILAANPVLNQSFIECDPSDRIFQVGTSIADSLWCMINHHIVARRMVPKTANPRII